MPPFRFRLQRVLEWQQRVCRLEQEKLRDCAASAAAAEERLAQLDAQTVSIEREFLSQQVLIPADLKALAEFRRSVVLNRQALAAERQNRLAALERQREAFLAENRKQRVLENLRERARLAHVQAADREADALGLESYLSKRA